MRLQQHIDNEVNLFDILLTLEMIETCHQADSLNEGAIDTVKGAIDKVKGFLKKSVRTDFWKMVEKDKNLGQHLYSFSIDAARLLFHGFNVHYNKSEESKQYIKELAKTVNNTTFKNILLKLDVVTLSMFTGPIEAIDVLTGWKVYDALKKKLKPYDAQARDAIKTIELLRKTLDNPAFKSQAQKYANALRRVFNLGGYKKIDEETLGADIAEPDIKIGDTVRKRLKKKDKIKKNPKKK